ncbi:Hsp20/alpha crystallin family protein [Trinickia fusca]|uniref:Hsp20/alpha crystallin family protein n=1 Tax=Trinickia fusca TaxID=2419777 RepID=A0A494XTB0_9BURK|nr:Hsp20/alpha crystallin family protein [Trinickia fusca]RKP52146.1 Hsp20/alpha crystallin family protein [Trinickia fusca]
MSNLTRHDPFSVESIPDLFQGLFSPMRLLTPFADVKIDVTESDSAFTVRAELPGVDKKDIDVKIDGNVVSISAKAERSKALKEGERVIRSERYSGQLSRSFSLTCDIDDALATAKYLDGVLTLTLPKKTTASRKPLQID